MASSKKRSTIWNFFTEPEPGKAKCGFCGYVFSMKSKSTTNLFRHIKSKHPGVADHRLKSNNDPGENSKEIVDNNSENLVQQDKTEKSKSKQSEKSNQKVVQCSSIQMYMKRPLPINKSKEIDMQLLKMISKEYHPISIVEDKEFIKFVNILNPNYNLPTRKTISMSLMPQIYESVKNKIEEEIKKATVVALSIDGWTSISNESYIGLICHYISDECNLQSNLLECFEYSQRHTGENICSEIERVIQEWSLSDKICAVVSDNAANMVAAIKKGKWNHVPRFAHSINLIVQRAISAIEPQRTKVRSIVEHFKRSPHASKNLENVQEKMGYEKIKLKQEVNTRWNSTYIMFNRFLKLKEPLLYIFANLDNGINLPTQRDFEIIKQFK